MYLTREAITAMLREIAAFAAGSTFVMSFLLQLEFAEPELQPALRMAEQGARASGTPFISFFTPAEMMTLAREAGFREARHISAADLAQPLFQGPAGRPAAPVQRRRAVGRDDLSASMAPSPPLCAHHPCRGATRRCGNTGGNDPVVNRRIDGDADRAQSL
jgi:hypothetical protein